MNRAIQVLAITGGKGGIGKTSIAINTAVALARAGRRVAILDADFGLANVDVLLGLHAERNIEQVLDGECSLSEIMLSGPEGIRILPAASGARRLTRLNTLEQAGLVRAFSDLAEQIDVLIVDTAAGIADSVLHFIQASREIVVVVCNEPSSITDAYAMVKVLARDFDRTRFRIVVNMVVDMDEGVQVYDKFRRVCDQFLEVSLIYAGCIPYDKALQQAIRQQRSVLELSPSSLASRAFVALADQVGQWPAGRFQGGDVAFFVENLIGGQRALADREHSPLGGRQS